MSSKSVEEVANAVLYEGYMLYPYRASSVKNRMRWNFGLVYPRGYSEAQGGVDPWLTQTECLIKGSPGTRVTVTLRFLRTVDRVIGAASGSPLALPDGAEPGVRSVPELCVGDQVFQSRQEATECEVSVGAVSLGEVALTPLLQPFELHEREEYEGIQGTNGELAGLVRRKEEQIAGDIDVAVSCIRNDLYKLTLRVSNSTPIPDSQGCSRERALRHALLSAHSILRVEQGEFISLLDPPADAAEFASACSNVGTWPVLAGDGERRDTILSSPIILYDYPQIAPESAGDLYDGTEIDEILALRILTLTEDEKRQMREGDDRARQILERTEALPPEQFAKLHGALRGLRATPQDQQ